MFDLTIRNGRISTSEKTFYADIGITDGKIAAIAPSLQPGLQDIDAQGQWVLPGGVDSHCHVEQLSGMGVMTADDFTAPLCLLHLAGRPASFHLPPSTGGKTCSMWWTIITSVRTASRSSILVFM